MLGIGFLPLFGAPGYEQALASGLLVPTAAAIATALDVGHPTTTDRRPIDSLGRGVVCGLGYAGVSILVSLLHAARVGICELWGALLYFLLTAGAGAILGGAWGAIAGEGTFVLVRRGLRRRRLVAVAAALAVPIGSIVLGVYRFWATPIIFAYDPFVGYFSGTLYDTVIDAGTPLLTYRLGSLATLAALGFFASITSRHPERPGFRIDLGSTTAIGRALLGVAAGIASLVLFLAQAKLGHSSTSETIAKDLGGEKHGARCDVVFPSTTPEHIAKLLVKDCDEEVAAVEKRLGTKGPARIRAFFFRDENDKKRLMGASHTYVAKPWREEVYLQMAGYPHPVLGHELAHVIAGSFGRGPFRIAGDANGWLPNPGLIEGVAVFASPDDEDLTDEQWARAMMQIGILPSMERVFSLSFLGDVSSKSYTLAGAFIGWVAGKWGIETVRNWYGGGDVHALTGKSWSDLDREFRSYLETVPLPAEAESFARAKFQRPGLFGRKCPHLVDALRREADVCRDTQRFEEAVRLYERTLAKDPGDFPSRHGKAVVFRKHLDPDRGRAELEELAKNEKVPRSWRDRAEEALADADFLDGNLDAARARYDVLAARSLDEDQARTLEVKSLATKDPDARDSIAALLTGDKKHNPDIFVAGVALGFWESSTAAPLASYLVGRNYVQRSFYEKGAAALDRALADELPTLRLARETLRQRAIAACALDDKEALAKVLARIESPDDPFKGASGGRRDSTLRMIARCGR